MSTKSSFIDMSFPKDISYGSIGGPEYFTDVVITANGKEQRNINWSNARRKFNVSHGVKNKDQFLELSSFFHNCKGKAIGFRFRDWGDFTLYNEFVGIYNNESDFRIKDKELKENIIQENTQFQIFKTYNNITLDGVIIKTNRIITKIVPGTIKLDIKDHVVNEADKDTENKIKNKVLDLNIYEIPDYTVIKNTSNFKRKIDAYVYCNIGIIILKKPLPYGKKLTVSCEFDIPARFDTDHLPAEFVGAGLYSINDIPIIELK